MNTLIVGATSSIGLPTVRLFVEAGRRVLATSRQGSERPENLLVTWSDLDLADTNSIESFVNSAVPAFSPLDAVVILAGILPGKPLSEYKDDELDLVMTVNFAGPVRLVRSLLTHLNNEAQIIMTSSVSGLRGSFDPVYAASKSALIGFTKSMAASLGPEIRVNAIAPSLVQDSTMYKSMAQEHRDRHIRNSPNGQLVTLGEVAELILQLTDPGWPTNTGEVIEVGDYSNR